jgi:very-short-patch-repair endonuclease
MGSDSRGKAPNIAPEVRGRDVVAPHRSQPPELWRDEVLREVLHAGLRRDAALALFAERQQGHVTRAQALAAGMGPGAFQGRIDRGYLYRVHRGVYRVGHTAPLEFDREMAAALAYGTRTVVSHASAVYLWALAPRPEGEVHVTGPDRSHRRRVRLHRSPVDPSDVVRRHGVPVTKPARTLLDFAANAAPLLLERAVEDALRRRLVTRRELGAELARRRPGSGPLRRLLAREEDPALTRSEAERRFAHLVRAAGLTAPEHNVLVKGMEVDLLWREQGLVVEVDGFAYHSGRAAFERDRVRDSRLVALGIRVMRVTWRQIVHEPSAVVAALAQALASGRSEVRS